MKIRGQMDSLNWNLISVAPTLGDDAHNSLHFAYSEKLDREEMLTS